MPKFEYWEDWKDGRNAGMLEKWNDGTMGKKWVKKDQPEKEPDLNPIFQHSNIPVFHSSIVFT